MKDHAGNEVPKHVHVYRMSRFDKRWHCIGDCGAISNQMPNGTVNEHGYIVVPTKVTTPFDDTPKIKPPQGSPSARHNPMPNKEPEGMQDYHVLVRMTVKAGSEAAAIEQVTAWARKLGTRPPGVSSVEVSEQAQLQA